MVPDANHRRHDGDGCVEGPLRALPVIAGGVAGIDGDERDRRRAARQNVVQKVRQLKAAT